MGSGAHSTITIYVTFKKLNFSVSIFPFPSRDNTSLIRTVMGREKRVKFMNLHRVAMPSHVITHT